MIIQRGEERSRTGRVERERECERETESEREAGRKGVSDRMRKSRERIRDRE